MGKGFLKKLRWRKKSSQEPERRGCSCMRGQDHGVEELERLGVRVRQHGLDTNGVPPKPEPIHTRKTEEVEKIPRDSVEGCDVPLDLYSKIMQPSKIVLCVGNPGSGKSTLLNSIIGEAKFQSGFKAGSGMTSALDEYLHEDILYIDTPGLADTRIRQRAALAIVDALRKGGAYKLLFVLTLEAGNIRAQDQVTMELILEALQNQLKENQYGIIINKIGNKFTRQIEKEVSNGIFCSRLFPRKQSTAKHFFPSTNNILCLEEVHELIDEDNGILPSFNRICRFLDKLPTVSIVPGSVKDIDWNKFEKIQKELEKISDEYEQLSEENKKLAEGDQMSKRNFKVHDFESKVRGDTTHQGMTDKKYFEKGDKIIVVSNINHVNRVGHTTLTSTLERFYGTSIKRVPVDTRGTVIEIKSSSYYIDFEGIGKVVIPFSKCKNRMSTVDRLYNFTLERLVRRGISLRHLLTFYQQLGKQFFLSFKSGEHTTEDVVKYAVIPETCKSGLSYAEQVGYKKAIIAEKMVSHNWSNKFSDLISAVVADALDVPMYHDIIPRLSKHRIAELIDELKESGKLDTTYWICAFSVNQHRTCRSEYAKNNGLECTCKTSNYSNYHPACEVDKFDQMLKDMVSFNNARAIRTCHVIAVDKDCKIFTRAWVLAEIVQTEVNASDVSQKFYAYDKKSLQRLLKEENNINIEKCDASNPEDKKMIISYADEKLGIKEFNAQLNKKIKRLAQTSHKDIEKAEKEHILCIGNIGVGITTLFEHLVGREYVKKHKGYKDGSLRDFEYDGKVLMDAPGLAHSALRRKTAKSITNAMNRIGRFKICFVVTLESGRVRPEDKETIAEVLTSYKIIQNNYTIIINKATKKIIDVLKGAGENLANLRKELIPGDNSNVYLGYVPKLVGKEGESLESFFKNILDKSPSVHMKKKSICIEEETLDEKCQHQRQCLEHLKRENGALRAMADGSYPIKYYKNSMEDEKVKTPAQFLGNNDEQFDNLNLYQSLYEVKGCVKVEIANIIVKNNEYIQGMTVNYRSTFVNGETVDTCGESNASRTHRLYTGDSTTETAFNLNDGEYIQGLRLQQGDVLDSITFLTNHRELKVGGEGGSGVDLRCPHPTRYRIVAFNGFFGNGALARVGFHSRLIPEFKIVE